MGPREDEKGSESRKVVGGVPVEWGVEMADNRWALVDEVGISPPVRPGSGLTFERATVEGHSKELVQLVRRCHPLEGRREAFGTVGMRFNGMGVVGWLVYGASYRQDPELLQIKN